MAKYHYKGVSEEGKKVSGTISAANEVELYQKLRETKIFLLESKEEKGRQHNIRITANALSDFCRSIGSLTGAGISLVKALSIVSKEETTKPVYRAVYSEVLKAVRQGSTLSDAMLDQGQAFPPMLIYMIRAAEGSGDLDGVCNRMAKHYEKEYKTAQKIRAAMTYPIVLLVLTVVVIMIIFTYIIPQFSELFKAMGNLPFVTRMIMGLSDVIREHWLAIICIVAALYVLISTMMHVPSVKRWWDKTILKMPLIGKLLRTIYTARFARTLSSLYTSGMSMVMALQIARSTIGNSYVDSQFDKAISGVRSGSTLSESVALIDGFNQKLVSSMMIGEESGSLDTMLDSIAEMLDYESDMAVGRLTTMLEPLMIIIMAIVIGTVIIAVIVPIYGSYEAIGK